MPSKNRIKIYGENCYYHVYNRGVNKRRIFMDETDYRVFLDLLTRYLSNEPQKDKYGRIYDNLSEKLDLLAFCLMPNHIHMLIHLNEVDGITDLLHRVGSSYVQYFNKRHGRVGKLFQDIFKASLIANEAYLWHISRYIHRNPAPITSDFINYDWSSCKYYFLRDHPSWIKPEQVLEMHKDIHSNYREFIENREDFYKDRSTLSLYLANK